MIPFNKPYLTGKETDYIEQAVLSGHLSGNGVFTKKCQSYFEKRWGFLKCLLTTSCTDALEMTAILMDIKQGDEVIIPSFTFVSTALAYVRQGAKIVFADSRIDHPGIDEEKLENLITSKTRAIVVVHYAGVACDMEKVMKIAKKHDLFVVEDAAQSIDSYYSGRDGIKKPLGTIGHLSAFSFHETKNIQCGEGGLLGINDDRFLNRAEIIWEKGTNRAEFFRGEVNKYGWVDTGSSFLPSEITAAFLWSQLENLDLIQKRRKEIWDEYYNYLNPLESKGVFKLPIIPDYATNNAHMFYLIFPTFEIRSTFIKRLNEKGVKSVFHYLSLHKSPYYANKYEGGELPESDRYSECLVRLPFYYDLNVKEVLKSIELDKLNK